MKWTAILLAAAAVGFVQSQVDPNKVLADMTKARTELLTQSRESGKPIDMTAYNAINDMAKNAIKDVDFSKVDVKDSYAWAQLCTSAQKYEPIPGLVDKFLSSSPSEQQAYSAASLGLTAASMMNNGKLALSFADKMKPYNDALKFSRASIILSRTSKFLFEVKGKEGALSYIDGLVAGLPTPDEKTKAMATSVNTAALNAKIEVYNSAKDTKGVIALLDKMIANAATDAEKSRYTAMKVQKTIEGSACPTLKVEKAIGDFKGMDAYKGKVLILDFFAHWCGPCKASFPDMRKMYADLHDKGLEVVHVTRYYGYYGQEKNLAPEQEFEKMKGFMKENDLPWPCVYVPASNFADFGCTAIPHVLLVGPDGKVEQLKIGYSAATFAEFRKHVEQLVQNLKK